MDRKNKIKEIICTVKGKVRVVTDPSEAFILMQQNVALKKSNLPLIKYEYGGTLKTAMDSFVRMIKTKRNEPKAKD